MIKDFRLSGQKPNHRIGDFRIGLLREEQPSIFSLIQKHNVNVRTTKQTLSLFGVGHVKKIPNGIQTEIYCGITRKVIVKTLNDGTSQVEELNG
jgi:hypothetical protein